MGDKSGPVVFLSDDSRKPMNIHPCSNSIVPIHGRSEYVKKLWNTTFISHLFSFWIDMNYFNPSMLVLYLANSKSLTRMVCQWVTFRGNLVSPGGNLSAKDWSMADDERRNPKYFWNIVTRISGSLNHSRIQMICSNWCVVAADAPNNWQLMPVRHVTISTIAPH